MNENQAKNIFETITGKSNKRKELFGIVGNNLITEDKNRYIFSSEFEISFIEKEHKARLLHLYFWQPGLVKNEIEKIIKKREKNIKTIFQNISQSFKCQYDNILLNNFFQFNRKNTFYPIQFGLEYQEKSKPKLKVYLSVNAERFPLEKFCGIFNLDYSILELEKKFKNKKFDTVALDFLPDGDYGFKFYPFTGLNKGKLYRVDKNTKITSIKNWLRFPDGLFVNNKKVVNFIKLPTYLYKIIKNNNFKIHYLCEENNKKSIYFR